MHRSALACRTAISGGIHGSRCAADCDELGGGIHATESGHGSASGPHNLASARTIHGRGSRATSWMRLRRSEEHTSELQSLTNLVCRLLLEKKKKKTC